MPIDRNDLMLLCHNPLPLIPVGAFRLARLFRWVDSTIAPIAPQSCILEVPGMVCEAEYRPEVARIFFRCRGGQSVHKFSVRVEPVYDRPFFICDCCNAHRTHLVIDDGQPLCIEKYRENGDPYLSRPVRNARVVIAHEDLRKLEPVATQWEPTEARAVARKQQPAAAPSARAKPKILHRLSTEKALELGRGATQYDFVREISKKSSGYFAAIETTMGYHVPDSVASNLEFPELNINKLKPALFREGKLMAQTLCWGQHSDPHVEILFISDWRGAEPQLVAFWGNLHAPVHMQRFALIRHSNGRLRFLCPERNEKFDTLYLRNGIFASRLAHRLVNPSQRAAGRKKSEPSADAMN